MSRGGARRRHGHGATAAGSAGAPGSRLLARPVVSVVVGGRRPGFDAVGRYHALFSASSLAADALASARSGSGMPLVPLRSVQAKACFGARPAFDVVGLLHGACARTEVHQVSLEIWTSNSHLSVSDRCEIKSRFENLAENPATPSPRVGGGGFFVGSVRRDGHLGHAAPGEAEEYALVRRRKLP